MSSTTFLVTGSMGCIGTWVIRHLIDSGNNIVASDLSSDPVRARLLMSDEEIAAINWQRLDVTDTQAVDALVAKYAVDHIIHLAGLQIPFCRANPALGSAVNVTGTVNVLEAARQHGVSGISYASSLAALGPRECYPEGPITDDAAPQATTLYGIYKTANEGTARIYWQDWQIGSVGLRPYVVYGVARDQGMTADPAKAVLAAIAGRKFHIRFDGPMAMQHASDTARIFIDCAGVRYQGARVCNLRGTVIEVSEFVDRLKSIVPGADITFEPNTPLPYPADLDDSGLREVLDDVTYTDIDEAIRNDLGRFEQLLNAGRVDLSQLDQ